MSDERLRDLERRVGESPADFALGHELVRELERAGKRRRAVAELRRLYRHGDADARRRLERLVAPWVEKVGRAPRDGLADPAKAKARQEVVKLDPVIHLVGATDDVVLVEGRYFFAGIDARTLALRWTMPTANVMTAYGLGGDVFLVRTPEAGLRLVDPRTGKTKRDLPLPPKIYPELHVDDREAIFRTIEKDSSTLIGLDLVSGKTLWREAFPNLVTQIHASGGLVTVGLGTRQGGPKPIDVEVRSTTTGKLLWRCPVPAVPWPGYSIRSDLEAVVFQSEGRLLALDRLSGKPLGPDRGRALVLAERHDALMVREPGSEAPRWRVPVERFGAGAYCFAGRHVWFGEKHTGPGDEIELSAFDRETGARVRHDVISMPGGRCRDFALVVLDGVVLVVVPGDQGAFLYQLADA
jgi:hypothetical protein